MRIDTTYDFRTDANGKDPDINSPTLRRYHKHLWSKPLPCGRMFELSDSRPRAHAYLHHQSELGEFYLSSDSIMPTFTKWKRMQHITSHFPEDENEAFRAIGYTIGGMMIWPAKKVGGRQTINAERGFNSRIADRMDLTLECIRRYYLGLTSPLDDTLSRYDAFFQLFGDFGGYVDFFLLHDLANEDCSAVRFFMVFDNFETAAVPRNHAEYQEYRQRSIKFVHARNRRIEHSYS